MLIDSLNNTRHPRIRVKSNKNKVIHSKKMKRHKTNLKPIACNAIHAGDGKRKTESGYIIDCVDNRLLFRKWPAA